MDLLKQEGPISTLESRLATHIQKKIEELPRAQGSVNAPALIEVVKERSRIGGQLFPEERLKERLTTVLSVMGNDLSSGAGIQAAFDQVVEMGISVSMQNKGTQKLGR